MANFVEDTFAGSGTIGGAALDIGYGASPDSWTQSAGLSKSGGYLTYAGLKSAFENCFYGSQASSYSNPESFTFTFVFRTGADVGAAAGGHYGLLINLGIDASNNILARVQGDAAGAWTLNINFDAPVSVSVTANTDYTGVITYDHATGAANLSFLGQSLNSSAYTPADALGFRRVFLQLGGTISVGSIAAAGPAPPATTALTAPMGFITTKGAGVATIYAPMGTLLAVGHDSTGENAFTKSAPMGTLIARGGAKAVLSAPKGVMSASGTTILVGTARLTAPMGVLSASGTTIGPGVVALRAPMGLLQALGGGASALVGPMGTLSANGTRVAGGVANLTAPMGQLLATISTVFGGSARLVAPMLVPGPYGQAQMSAPMGGLKAYGRLVIEITYEAYAINLKPGNRAGVHEVSHYTNWPFDGIVRHGSRYYAWGPAGLFEIGGATDYNAATPLVPTPIPWDWMTTVTDFGSSQKKAMRQMAIGGRIGPNVVAKVATGRDADYSYRYSTSRGQKAQNYRVKLGKGLDDRYYSFGLAGTGEGDVDTIDIDVETLSRKV